MSKLNSETKSKMAILQKGLKWPNISKKSLKEFGQKKVRNMLFKNPPFYLKILLFLRIVTRSLQNLYWRPILLVFTSTWASMTTTLPFSCHLEPKIDSGGLNLA